MDGYEIFIIVKSAPSPNLARMSQERGLQSDRSPLYPQCIENFDHDAVPQATASASVL